MDFYSSVSGILVVHISDYSGKLCLSARLCFLFMRKQRWYPLLNNFVHILITSIIYGIMGMFCCATSFYFRNRKTVYFVSIFFWLIEILKPGSLLRTNSIAFLCKYAIVKLNIYFGKYYVAN